MHYRRPVLQFWSEQSADGCRATIRIRFLLSQVLATMAVHVQHYDQPPINITRNFRATSLHALCSNRFPVTAIKLQLQEFDCQKKKFPARRIKSPSKEYTNISYLCFVLYIVKHYKHKLLSISVHSELATSSHCFKRNNHLKT